MKSVYNSILCCIAIVSMFSCSKSGRPVEPSQPQLEDWVYDESLPVPISFGSDNCVLMKSAIDASNVEGTQFGIFSIDVNSEETWSETAASVLMYNKVSEYTTNGGESTLAFVTKDGNVTYYYPLVTDYNYTFYGYHTQSATVAEDENAFSGYYNNGNSFCTDVTLGNVDILWAKASATAITGTDNEESLTVEGFNASYSRWARKWYPAAYSDYDPMFNFKHLTTALHFKAVAEDIDAENTLKDKLSIYDLSISNVPTRARLCIAARDSSQEGILTPLGTNGTIFMHKGEKSENLEAYPTVAGTEIGDGMFILPMSAEDVSVSFNLLNPDGTKTLVKRTLPMPSSGQFEIGKRYDFTIIIKSIEEIVIRASVEGWQDGFPDEDSVIDTLG